MQRVADGALRKLIALFVVRRAGGQGHGAVNGFDDGRHRRRRGWLRERVTPMDALVRGEQPRPYEPRQHLAHQPDRNVILFGDFPGAGRLAPRIGREVLHRHQGVIRLLGEP